MSEVERRWVDTTPFGSAVTQRVLANEARHHEVKGRLGELSQEEIEVYLERGYEVVHVGRDEMTLRCPIIEKGNKS